MSGAIPPLSQYVSMAWCSVKAQKVNLINCGTQPLLICDFLYEIKRNREIYFGNIVTEKQRL
jgi:hypothetical protein